MKVSIVIPAYNEEKRIGKTLKEYSRHFESLRRKNKLDYEILIVINSSTDRTEEIVKKFKKKNRRINYFNLNKGGKGSAIIEGFKHALKRKNHLIGFVDCDMSTTPQEYSRLIQNIKDYDGIIASRYVQGAKVSPKPTPQRIIASRIYNALIRTLFFFPYRDTQCGAKIFKRKVIEKIINSFILTRWAFDVDLIYNARKQGFKIKEFPTVWADKEYSKLNFARTGPFMALSIMRLRLLNSPFNFIVKFYDNLPDWIKIHNKFR